MVVMWDDVETTGIKSRLIDLGIQIKFLVWFHFNFELKFVNLIPEGRICGTMEGMEDDEDWG